MPETLLDLADRNGCVLYSVTWYPRRVLLVSGDGYAGMKLYSLYLFDWMLS